MRKAEAVRNLASHILVKPAEVWRVLDHPETHYKEKAIPKRDGGLRRIMGPDDDLKAIQRAVLTYILSQQPVSPIAHGCVQGRSVITNASEHQFSRSMVKIDLEDAYGSIGFSTHVLSQVEFGLPSAVLDLVAELVEVTHNKGHRCLPQGAPTSPYLFNLACWRIDRRLLRVADRVDGKVTRYVDDIVLSINGRFHGPLVRGFIRAAELAGTKDKSVSELRINSRKTMVIQDGNRASKPLRLPGVIIADNLINLSPKLVRRLRMMLYCAGWAYQSAIFSEAQAKAYGKYAAIRGLAIQIYGELPPQLSKCWPKAIRRAIEVEEGISCEVMESFEDFRELID